MKILIFGATGMLGHKLFQKLSGAFDVTGTIRGSYDDVKQYDFLKRDRIIEFTSADDAASINSAIAKANPDVVMNAIGVVKQLPSAKNVIKTLEINSMFPNRLAELAQTHGFRLITISTDCVFDGVRGFYSENDQPNANDLYGKSKNLGEVSAAGCVTLRTSIIGRELGSAHSLVEWFLSNRGGSVKGFTNAIYSGFPTIVFADIITSLITDHKEISGLYHVAADPITKFDLLTLVNKYYETGIDIVASDELKIDRSLDGRKFEAATGFTPLPWEEMIKTMAADRAPYETYRK